MSPGLYADIDAIIDHDRLYMRFKLVKLFMCASASFRGTHVRQTFFWVCRGLSAACGGMLLSDDYNKPEEQIEYPNFRANFYK